MQNNRVKNILKFVGILLLLAGFTFAIIGFSDFFKAFSNKEKPAFIWCMFLGLPLMGLGSGFSVFAFRREICSLSNDTSLDKCPTDAPEIIQENKCTCGEINDSSSHFC